MKPRATKINLAPARRGDTLLVHDLTLQVEEAQEALTAIRAGEVDALVVTAADSSPRVFLLKGADDAHRVLLETLNEGAMTIGPDAMILYANRRLAELVGHALQKVLGTPLTRFLAPESRAAFEALLAGVARGGSSKGEVSLVTAAGDAVPVMVSMRPVGDDSQTITAVVTDLSPLKQAERALRRANDELEARVLARTAEIERVNAALREEVAARTQLAEELSRKAAALVEADQRKDEFLSMLAHELRNPLAPIVTAAEILRPIGREKTTVERCRAVIERQAKNLTRLVDDLLDVSRITRRAISLRPQTVELRAIVQSAVEAARPLIDAAGHALSVRLPPEPVPLFVDPTRFEQVLVNLLNNAAKYTDPGGRIAVNAARDGEHLTIAVEDTGAGIPPELLPHVFDLFVQGKRSLARSQGGLGIGLTMVKNLVEMHGGTANVRSPGAGRGTTVSLRVPLPSARRDGHPSAADDRPAASDRARPERARRVLLVEDNVDAAESLTDLLELWGHEVRAVGNGEDAIRVAREMGPDAAIVDVGLPGMDGYEVARRLRRSAPSGDRLLVIAASGYGQARDRQQGIDAGFDHYLVKPLDPDVLGKLLDGAEAGARGRSR